MAYSEINLLLFLSKTFRILSNKISSRSIQLPTSPLQSSKSKTDKLSIFGSSSKIPSKVTSVIFCDLRLRIKLFAELYCSLLNS